MTVAGHRGFVLVTVVILTAVGLLFGVGALLLFRFQCQMRIERQHELEKVYAVRSALNWARSYEDHVPMDGMPLRYYTGSGRSLNLLVKPVEITFPDLNFVTNTGSVKVKHLIMDMGVKDGEDDWRYFTVSGAYPNQYNESLDYEYGMMTNVVDEVEEVITKPDLAMVSKVDESSITNHEKGNEDGKDRFGIDFPDSTVTNVKWWVNVGMLGKGGWAHEEYGRRYYFKLSDLVGRGDTGFTGDIFNLCIIKHTYNENINHPGCRHGWPLSNNEKALVLRIEKNRNYTAGQKAVEGYLKLYECVYGAKPVLLASYETPGLNYEMGLQIAGKKVSLFWFAGNDLKYPASIKRGDRELSDETYLYFRGHDIDNNGRIRSSPDLRVVFEMIAASTKRTGENTTATSGTNFGSEDFIESFKVAPAYQYDIFLKCPNVIYSLDVGVRATVAQLMPKDDDSIGYPIITYDTHGTDNRGFRKDEREAEKKRNGW